MNLKVHPPLMILAGIISVVRPLGLVPLAWLALWGLTLCDRQIKSQSTRQPWTRRYQLLLGITYLSSLCLALQ